MSESQYVQKSFDLHLFKPLFYLVSPDDGLLALPRYEDSLSNRDQRTGDNE